MAVSITKINRWWSGKTHSEESKKKMSESAKGRTPWNKGKKGLQTSWNKGIKYGKGRKLPDCIDCGKKLGGPCAKRCAVCSGILHRGEKSPNWKGGTMTKNRLERVKFQKTMKKKIFERDNYICQLCGEKSEYLQTDHIQKWSEYPELRFNLENCRTLCMDCHYQMTFGKPKPKNIVWGHNLSYKPERMVA